MTSVFSWQNSVSLCPASNNTRKDSTHGHHQMVNTEITLIIFFAAKDGENVYSQQSFSGDVTIDIGFEV